MMRGLNAENSGMRGLTGQGEPGLYTLLGGTETQGDAAGTSRNLVGAFQRKSNPYKDMRLAAVAAPAQGGAGGGSGGGGGGGGGSGGGSIFDRERLK